MCEVEKIWIIYDLDNNGTLDYSELIWYLNEVAVGGLQLSSDELKIVFEKADKDFSKTVSKQEM